MFESFRSQAAQKISGWSLEEKVGQLFILAFPGKDAEAARPLIERYNLGGCYLSQDNAATFAEARQLTQAMAAIVNQRVDSVPMLLGVDQEGAWSVLTPESTTGPGNLALGSADNPALSAQMYSVFGIEMRSAGFNCVLGPCADVNLKPNSPIIDTRAFGEVPTQVAVQVGAAVHGAHDGGIVVCAKHFPGHGDTTGDTHREIPVVDKSLATLMVEDLAPFKAAIDARVELMMTSHICYPQIDPVYPATLSKAILQDVLREKLGFKGIVISDSMNMGAIRRNFPPVEAAIIAFKAGIDMMMLSEEHYDHNDNYLENQLAMIGAIVSAVEDGRMPEAELNLIVERVVAFKLARLVGMPLFSEFNLEANRKVEQASAKAAVKILTDPARNLPIQADKQVFVLQTTPLADYANLVNPRGIGPNQATPAFDYFAAEISAGLASDRLSILDYTEAKAWLAEVEVAPNQLILAVIENYPLPGEDFKQAASKALVAELAAKFGAQLVVIGLRNAYEAVPELAGHVCAYGSRECSARAAAQVCLSI
jgi:beta-N-acetylhexosaminidase